jgi:hypothetical protein
VTICLQKRPCVKMRGFFLIFDSSQCWLGFSLLQLSAFQRIWKSQGSAAQTLIFQGCRPCAEALQGRVPQR